MKGVPIRLEIGPKEVEKKELTVYRRDLGKKETIKEKGLLPYLGKASLEITENLRKEADKKFRNILKDAKTKAEVKEIVSGRGIARINFCTTSLEGEACAETIEKEIGAKVRGTRIDKKETPPAGAKCLFCGKKANVVAYVAKEY